MGYSLLKGRLSEWPQTAEQAKGGVEAGLGNILMPLVFRIRFIFFYFLSLQNTHTPRKHPHAPD